MSKEDVREDFLDYPTAWRIQEELGAELLHLYACSAFPKPDSANRVERMAGPAFLCDCGAVVDEWKERVRLQQEAREMDEVLD